MDLVLDVLYHYGSENGGETLYTFITHVWLLYVCLFVCVITAKLSV